MTDICEVPRCRGEAALVYLGRTLCDDCWNQFSADDAPANAFRMVLSVEADVSTAITEEAMAKKKTETTSATDAAQAAEVAPTAATATEVKPKAGRKPKASKAAKTKAETKPAAETPVEEPKPAPKKRARKGKETAAAPKPKKERPPKEDLCVFALRMTEAERTKLHETAGPRGATRLARAVLVAAANEDESSFRTALKEAAKLRA